MADVSHRWTVKRDGKEIGTVEAITRKGACFDAYEKFAIPHHLRHTIAVELETRDIIRHRSGLVIAVDPASENGDEHIVCSFNPNLQSIERRGRP